MGARRARIPFFSPTLRQPFLSRRLLCCTPGGRGRPRQLSDGVSGLDWSPAGEIVATYRSADVYLFDRALVRSAGGGAVVRRLPDPSPAPAAEVVGGWGGIKGQEDEGFVGPPPPPPSQQQQQQQQPTRSMVPPARPYGRPLLRREWSPNRTGRDEVDMRMDAAATRRYRGGQNARTFLKQVRFVAGGSAVATGSDSGHLLIWQKARCRLFEQGEGKNGQRFGIRQDARSLLCY